MNPKANARSIVAEAIGADHITLSGGLFMEKQFLKIRDAATATGLSQYFLRNGCKDGSVPHIKSGKVYLVNVPALVRKLDADSVQHE